MPFTPYHLGIALLLSALFYRKLDILSLCIGSVILDVWSFMVMFFNLPYDLHEISHTLLVAFIVAALLGLARLIILPKIRFRYAFLSSLAGTFSHVILDSPLYRDMIPLWPLSWNPLRGLWGYSDAVIFSILSFAGAGIVVLVRLVISKCYLQKNK